MSGSRSPPGRSRCPSASVRGTELVEFARSACRGPSTDARECGGPPGCALSGRSSSGTRVSVGLRRPSHRNPWRSTDQRSREAPRTPNQQRVCPAAGAKRATHPRPMKQAPIAGTGRTENDAPGHDGRAIKQEPRAGQSPTESVRHQNDRQRYGGYERGGEGKGELATRPSSKRHAGPARFEIHRHPADSARRDCSDEPDGQPTPSSHLQAGDERGDRPDQRPYPRLPTRERR